MKRVVCLLLSLILTLPLAGCGEKQPEEPAVTESLVWEETPQLSHGVLEYEKLTVQPWYCGRLEFTGGNNWAETELGYYYYDSGDSTLYYADKANLSNWVPVCGKPACLHTMNIRGCNSHLGGNDFLIRNGRIFYIGDLRDFPELYTGEGSGPAVFSKALDGTDPRLEYLVEEAVIPSGGSHSELLTPEHLFLNVSIFNSDGTYTCKSLRLTEEGVEVLAEETIDEPRAYMVFAGFVMDGMMHAGYNGEDILCNEMLGGLTTVFRSRNGSIETLDISGYEREGRYLSGNTLRLYRENDGYYDLDLTTRQETKVVEAQLENAFGTVLLPNCLVERSGEQILIFDGESWRSVEIPEELQGSSVSVEAVASDRIFFVEREYYGTSIKVNLYQVMLGQETLRLEYCGKVT